MAKLGDHSKREMLTTHEKLQLILIEAIAVTDFKVLEGHRSPQDQKKYFEMGRSKKEVSKHNRFLSHAVDIAPWPIPKNWGVDDKKEFARFYYLAGVIKGIAFKHNIKIRWGGDWDGDGDFNDQTFDDLVHFELL